MNIRAPSRPILETKLLDNMSGLYIDRAGIYEWLMLHTGEMDRFFNERYGNYADCVIQMVKAMDNPINMITTYLQVKDYIEPNFEKMDRMLQKVIHSMFVMMMVGKKDGGKTAFMAWLSQRVHDMGYEVYWLESNLNLPAWIRFATRLEEIHGTNDRPILVVIDEASITVNAREAMTTYNKDMSKVLAIARHQNLRVVFCSQHLDLTDKNIYRLSDGWFLKQMQMTEMIDMHKQRHGVFYAYLRIMQPISKSQTLFTDGNDWMIIETSLVSWWTDDISKGWSKLDREATIKFIANAFESAGSDGVDLKIMAKQLKTRGQDLDPVEIEDIYDDYLARINEKKPSGQESQKPHIRGRHEKKKKRA